MPIMKQIFKQTRERRLVCLGLVMLLFMLSKSASAQQDPLYSQYMFNIQVVNPAYAGTWNSLGFTAVSRNQWLGVDKAPTTNSLSVQAPTRGEHVGLGASVVNDKYGYVNRLAFFTDYSYRLQLNDRGTSLRFGLKAGFSNYTNNLSAHEIQEDGDESFQGLIEQRFMPNFGVGLFLHDENYYLGASIPKMLEHRVESSTDKNWSIRSDIRHFFFMGGYVFNIDESFKFKPSFMTKMVNGAPFQADINANFLLKERFWFGGMYRTGSGFGVNLQWIVDEKLRVGYAIDYSKQGIYENSMGIHELMISYELNFTKNIYRSPRYY